MKLSAYDLKQLDEDKIAAMTHDGLVHCAKKLLSDLKEATDRLNQNSQNSSRPSGSEAPWEGAGKGDAEDDADNDDDDGESDGATKDGEEGSEKPESPADQAEGNGKDTKGQDADAAGEGSKGLKSNGSAQALKRRAGKQPGAQGYGRKQNLEVTGIENHFVCDCAACGSSMAREIQTPWNGWYSIDIAEPDQTRSGIFLTNTKHVLYACKCQSCGHSNRVYPYQGVKDAFWDKTDLSEWRLVGPRLASMLVLLSVRFRLSRARIREFLIDFLRLELAIGTINSAIREAARGAAPLETELLHDIGKAAVVYADETSWLEAGNRCWLWVIKTTLVVLFFVGKRDRQTFCDKLQQSGFSGTLMTDGYGVYRDNEDRLRCWAHLIRKARGLAQSCDKVASVVGGKMLALFTALQEAIYEARAAGIIDISGTSASTIESLASICSEHKDSPHDKLKTFSRELRNDQGVIFRQTRDTSLPLTNNDAERSLRHCVISRRLSYGTRTPQGTLAFTILASVIETCRLRCISAWNFITRVIADTRKGLAPPALNTFALVTG